ncbi:class II fructose-bisphosphate aldolase [Thermoanaerobacterium sp. DL9XJH110]|uniref:class II fructose-bisphosphate aldolase n=1 Tax=Thermoanaerobacterium sp. DL9XJH110 TaxID=3386643 RepID=UPI003BB667A2
MLVNLKPVLTEAKMNKYAVGAFNVYNYETIKGVVESVRELKIPAVIAFGERYIENMQFKEVFALVDTMIKDLEIPVVLHLDHCKSFENIIRAIRAGFTSVMFDGSELPFEENVKRTEKIVAVARAAGVSVEAELGSIAAGRGSSEEGYREIYTDPAQAEEFVESTGVDALAVSIGTVHGIYKGEPRINMDVLKEVASRVDIPLVLHGGSGTPEGIIKECIKNGICKINVNTEISLYTLKKIKEMLADEGDCHLSRVSLKEVEYIKDVVKKYMLLFYNA